jgi:hypothetical protein
MASELQQYYPDFWNAVWNDAVQALALYNQTLSTRGAAAAAPYADQVNRDYALLAIDPFLPGNGYSLPASYASVPPVGIPRNVPLPFTAAGAIGEFYYNDQPSPYVVPPVVIGAPVPTPAAPPAAAAPVPVPITPAGTPDSGGPAPLQPLLNFGEPGIAEYCSIYPEDPICYFPGGTSISITGGSTSIVNNNTYIVGETAADVNSTVNGALAGLWAVVVQTEDAVLSSAIAGVKAALTAIANALAKAFAVLARLAGLILNFLATLWKDIVKGIRGALQGLVAAVKDIYNDVLKPLHDALQKLREAITKIYEQYVRPVLIALQKFRQLLAILKLFHIPFANKLDAALADIQRRITQPMIVLLGYVNQVANWINLILDARYLLQQPLLLNSAKANIGGLIGLGVQGMSAPVDPAALAAIQAANASLTTPEVHAALSEYLQTGTGSFAAPIADAGTVFNQQLLAG